MNMFGKNPRRGAGKPGAGGKTARGFPSRAFAALAALAGLAACAAFALAACSAPVLGLEGTGKCTLYFNPNTTMEGADTEWTTITARQGETITLLPEPEWNTGWRFYGWKSESDLRLHAPLEEYKVEKSETFYGDWGPASYDINFFYPDNDPRREAELDENGNARTDENGNVIYFFNYRRLLCLPSVLDVKAGGVYVLPSGAGVNVDPDYPKKWMLETGESYAFGADFTVPSGEFPDRWRIDFFLVTDRVLSVETPSLTIIGTTGTEITPVDVSTAISGGALPYKGYSADTLPEGLIIDPATGLISGTPAANSAQPVTVTIEDRNGAKVSVSVICIIA